MNTDPDHSVSAPNANQEAALVHRTIDAGLRYEIRAECFRLETGFVAPGKDSRDGNDPEEVNAVWAKWNAENKRKLDTFFYAAGKVLF